MYNYKHVLILDDNSMDNFLLKEVLDSIHFAEKVTVFERATQAVEYLEKCTDFPDLIFTDINMPVMNGFDFIDTIRKKFPSSRFIVISSSDDFIDIKRSYQYPQVVNYLVKPITKLSLHHISQAS